MGNLINKIFLTGIIGAGSLGIFGNVIGQDYVKKDTTKKINAIENAFKRKEIVDSIIYTYNSMIPAYNLCIENGAKNNKDNCEKIFLEKLTKCDSLLKKIKLLPVQNGYYSVKVAFTDEITNKLLSENKIFYNATQFLLNNQSQQNYDKWQNKLEIHKKNCQAIWQ